MVEALNIPRTNRMDTLLLNLGVYLDRPSIAIPKGGMSDCLNVRVKDGQIRRENMGWEPFFDVQLNGQVLLIDQFFTRTGAQILIFGTRYDLYQFDEGTNTVLFITPTYATGTVTVADAATTVTGVGSFWATAKAVGAGNNAVAGYEIAFGDAAEYDPTATWYPIDSITNDTELELVTGHSGGVAGVDYTIRQMFTGDNSDIWAAETFPDAQEDDEDKWFATNGVDALVMWDGSDDTVSWYDPGFTCRVLFRYKNMMLYGDILESGERKNGVIRNSAIAYPENVTTLEAGEFNSSDGVDTILALAQLGDSVVAYHERSVNLIQFVGAPLNFVVRTAVPGIGLLSSRALMDFGDFHEILSFDSAYRFDGVGIQEMGGQVFREVLRKMDPNRLGKTLAHIDEENAEVLWAVPQTTDQTGTAGGPLLAYSSHYLENVSSKIPTPITIRELPATATGFFQRATTLRFSDMTLGFDTYNFKWNDRYFAAAFPYNLFGDQSGNVFILGTVDHQDGSDIVSYGRLGRIALGDGNQKGLVTRIEPFCPKHGGASYTLGVLLWLTDRVEGDLALGVQSEFDLTHVGLRYVNPRQIGRFGEVEFATTGQNQPWEVSGYAIETLLAGGRG